MKHHALTVLILALSLAACTPQPSPEPSPASTPMSTEPSTSPSAHPQEQLSRGYQQSPLPSFVDTPEEHKAAEFVRIAATPDTRIDPNPTSTWQRAARYLTPELAHEVSTQKNYHGGSWWTELVSLDGYITIEITNVIGGTPQAAPAPNDPEPTPEQDIYEVMFTRTLHYRTHQVRDELPYLWSVTFDTNGQITDFTTDH